MTDQGIIAQRFEAESATRLEAATRHFGSGDASALRLELHRWRVALRAAGDRPAAALTELERWLQIGAAVAGAFDAQPSVDRQHSSVLEQHRHQRAARAAGRTGILGLQLPELAPLEQGLPERMSAAKAAPPRAADNLIHAPASSGAASLVAQETVRVPVAKLDALLALSGELRVAQIRATARADQLGALLGSMNAERRQWRKRQADPVQLLERLRERTAHNIKQLAALERQLALDNAQLNTLTRGIEDQVLGARLLPAALLLPPLERLVRDLSQQLERLARYLMPKDQTALDEQHRRGYEEHPVQPDEFAPLIASQVLVDG